MTVGFHPLSLCDAWTSMLGDTEKFGFNLIASSLIPWASINNVNTDINTFKLVKAVHFYIMLER